MKSKFAAFILLFAAVFVLASCLNSDDNYTYNDDSAITSFSITSAKQYLHVKSANGGDSVVVKDVKLSSYKFYINQQTNEIYNPDSLPCGVNTKRLICSISSKNSGVVLMKSYTSDSLSYISSADSLDFSATRELHVYSNSGNAVRKYTVKVNVHNEMPDSFVWHNAPDCEAIQSLSAVRLVALDGKVLLFGKDGDHTSVFVNSGDNWTPCTPNFNHLLAADAYMGVVTKDNRAFISDGGNIMSTADGSNWTVEGSATGITRLVAASSVRLYGYAADGRLMASSDNGNSWSAATLDDDISLLPTAETAYTCQPVVTNEKTERVLLFGSRNATSYPSDNNLTIWGKVDEWAADSENQPWNYYNVAPENSHKAPLLTNISAFCYDGKALVFGNAKSAVVPAVYSTRDGGITWTQDTTVVVPDNFVNGVPTGGNTRSFGIASDKNNVVWLVNAGSGKTWRGRLNRLGWKKEQTDFTE